MSTMNYPFEVRPLSSEEGGGWLITYLALPGCMSDGEAPEQAIKNGKDALECWIHACNEANRNISLTNELSSGKD